MKNINTSLAIAISIVILTGAWMGSGYLRQKTAQAAPETELPPPEVMSVKAVQLQSRAIPRMMTIQGELEPVRTATLRAETHGQIAKILAERGDVVHEGDVLVELKLKDRKAKLKEAEALVRQRQMEFEARKSLLEKELVAEIAVKEAKAALESARAVLEAVQLEIADTRIRAPFDGVLEQRTVELGDLVAVNGEVGLVVDTSSLVAVGHVPQQEIEHVHVNQQGTVRFITGHQAPGRVRYVASMPDEGTQTFRIELVVENKKRTLPSGVSAELSLPLETVDAHFISPAALVLGEDGQVGVKTLDQENRVHFHPVQTVRSEGQGIWISGLPDEVSVITTGQGFVAPGETVVPVYNTPFRAGAQSERG